MPCLYDVEKGQDYFVMLCVMSVLTHAMSVDREGAGLLCAAADGPGALPRGRRGRPRPPVLLRHHLSHQPRVRVRRKGRTIPAVYLRWGQVCRSQSGVRYISYSLGSGM